MTMIFKGNTSINKIMYEFFIYLILICFSPYVYGEVIFDGTLGQGGSLSGPNFMITDDLGLQLGGNLFHSFRAFNIFANQSATFTGPHSVENIIARVTGGSESFINGNLRSTIQGANLYLLNPWGVMFGPQASLDISGSFHVSTADYIQLGQTGRFDALNPENSVLTTAPPSAFGFTGTNPADISIEGSFLKVPEGETLSLIGGDIKIQDAALYAPGGRIAMVSAASSGQAVVTDSGFNLSSFGKLGNIRLTHTSSEQIIDDDGNKIGNIDVSSTGAGSIYIRGGNFFIDGGSVKANTWGEENGNGIDIKLTHDLTIDKKGIIQARTEGKGDGGDILIRLGRLCLLNDSQINLTTTSAGEGGDLTIKALESIFIEGAGSGIFSDAFSTGDGGAISINSPLMNMSFGDITTITRGEGKGGDIFLDVGTLNLDNVAEINASAFRGKGDGGKVMINAYESIVLNSSHFLSTSEFFSSGSGGNIYVSTPSLIMNGGASIEAVSKNEGEVGDILLNLGHLTLTESEIDISNTHGGTRGNLTINAYESIMTSGSSSGIFSKSLGSGDGGIIRIATPHLTITNKAEISSDSAPIVGDGGNAGDVTLNVKDLSLTKGGKISTSTIGKGGDGGNLTINAEKSVTISGSDSSDFKTGIFSETQGRGKGGNIKVKTKKLKLTEEGTLSAESLSPDNNAGTAGNIKIKARNTNLNKGRITTSAQESRGGNIRITGRQIYLSNESEITAEAHGTHNAGNIVLSSSDLSVDNSQISSNTGGQGRGGNVMLSGNDVYLIDHSVVSAESSGTGNAGTITVKALNTFQSAEGARISTSTSNKGEGGNIQLTGSDIYLINNGSILAESSGTGNAGTITVKALNIFQGTEDSQISTKTSSQGEGGNMQLTCNDISLINNSSILAESSGTGHAGTITVKALNTFQVTEGSQISTKTISQGEGGNIQLTGNDIYLTNNSSILAESSGTGNAGTIEITAQNTLKSINSTVTTAAREAAGGNIQLSGKEVFLTSNSDITASVAQGIGGGGNVTINAFSLIALDDSDITARADQGFGGNISINTQLVFLNEEIDLNASSNIAGREGTVEINSPVVDISGFLVELPVSFLTIDELEPRQCLIFEEEQSSSFVISGPGGLPPGPADLLPEP
jgi:filamentous hemagglutinin family protein